MNKSRRMLSLQARDLAAAGVIAVIPDLYGLGDSEGTIEDASFDIWRADLERICHAISENYRPRSVHVVALRSASFLVDFVSRQELPVSQWIFWSPATNGSRFVKNLYRQALIAARNRGDTNTTTDSIRERTFNDGFIEISGYRFSSELMDQLEQAALPKFPSPEISVMWIDIRAEPNQDPQPVAPAVVKRWREMGIQVSHQIVTGPPFWQTAEISVVPELIEATSAVILEADRA